MDETESQIGGLDLEGLTQDIDPAALLEQDQKGWLQTREQENQIVEQNQDPRNQEGGGGVAGVAKEIQSAVVGGLQDTLHSVQTLPERAVDMVSGEMQQERKEKGYYEPEWSPFRDEDNPIITNTWWGNLLRGTVHFLSLIHI